MVCQQRVLDGSVGCWAECDSLVAGWIDVGCCAQVCVFDCTGTQKTAGMISEAMCPQKPGLDFRKTR